MRLSYRIILATVSLGIASTAFAAFSDVPASHPNAQAVIYAQSEGIIQGYPDGTFKPDQRINRAEFSKILAGKIHPECTDKDAGQYIRKNFSDVSETAWYVPWVCTLFYEGSIQGYVDGTFRPEADISFVEAAKLIAIKYRDHAPIPYYAIENLAESIKKDDPLWFRGYLYSLTYNNAVPMSIKRLDQKITRGELVEVIYRMQHPDHAKPSRPYKDLDDYTVRIPGLFPRQKQNYFLILGTYKDRETALTHAADQDAWVLDTSLTTKLSPGFQAVVYGPFP